jgi:hypothetical protein
MPDPWLKVWFEPSLHRKVVHAESQLMDTSQNLFRVAFRDDAGKQLAIPLPDTALRMLVETGAGLLGISLQEKAPNPSADK